MNKPVATIELDREDCARGTIRLISTSEGIEVECYTPDGVESPALPAFASEQDALDAIEASWGPGPWDLQWI